MTTRIYSSEGLAEVLGGTRRDEADMYREFGICALCGRTSDDPISATCPLCNPPTDGVSEDGK